MVKSYRSKKHNKKHRGGEGEVAEDNSVLNMDDKAPASAPAPTPASSPEPESAPAPASAPASTAAPVEEEKKSWFKSLFGGSKKKHVRFRTTKKAKHGGSKRSGSKRTKKAKHGGSKKSKKSKRKGSSRK
jgi:hypothetical protein